MDTKDTSKVKIRCLREKGRVDQQQHDQSKPVRHSKRLHVTSGGDPTCGSVVEESPENCLPEKVLRSGKRRACDQSSIVATTKDDSWINSCPGEHVEEPKDKRKWKGKSRSTTDSFSCSPECSEACERGSSSPCFEAANETKERAGLGVTTTSRRTPVTTTRLKSRRESASYRSPPSHDTPEQQQQQQSRVSPTKRSGREESNDEKVESRAQNNNAPTTTITMDTMSPVGKTNEIEQKNGKRSEKTRSNATARSPKERGRGELQSGMASASAELGSSQQLHSQPVASLPSAPALDSRKSVCDHEKDGHDSTAQHSNGQQGVKCDKKGETKNQCGCADTTLSPVYCSCMDSCLKCVKCETTGVGGEQNSSFRDSAVVVLKDGDDDESEVTVSFLLQGQRKNHEKQRQASMSHQVIHVDGPEIKPLPFTCQPPNAGSAQPSTLPNKRQRGGGRASSVAGDTHHHRIPSEPRTRDNLRAKETAKVSEVNAAAAARKSVVQANIQLMNNLPYMGELTFDTRPRRGRKPKKADICHLISKNYGIQFPISQVTVEKLVTSRKQPAGVSRPAPTKSVSSTVTKSSKRVQLVSAQQQQHQQTTSRRKSGDVDDSSGARSSRVSCSPVHANTLLQRIVGPPAFSNKDVSIVPILPTPISGGSTDGTSTRNKVFSVAQHLVQQQQPFIRPSPPRSPQSITMLPLHLSSTLVSRDGSHCTTSSTPDGHESNDSMDMVPVWKPGQLQIKEEVDDDDFPLNLCIRDKRADRNTRTVSLEPLAENRGWDSRPEPFASPLDRKGSQISVFPALPNSFLGVKIGHDSQSPTSVNLSQLSHPPSTSSSGSNVIKTSKDCSVSRVRNKSFTNLVSQNEVVVQRLLRSPSSSTFTSSQADQQHPSILSPPPISVARHLNRESGSIIGSRNKVPAFSPTSSFSVEGKSRLGASKPVTSRKKKDGGTRRDISIPDCAQTDHSEAGGSATSILAPSSSATSVTLSSFGDTLFGQSTAGMNDGAEVSICKFKFTGGAKPCLQEKKMLSVDSGGNFRFYTDKTSTGTVAKTGKAQSQQFSPSTSSSQLTSTGNSGGFTDMLSSGPTCTVAGRDNHFLLSSLPKSARAMSTCVSIAGQAPAQVNSSSSPATVCSTKTGLSLLPTYFRSSTAASHAPDLSPPSVSVLPAMEELDQFHLSTDRPEGGPSVSPLGDYSFSSSNSDTSSDNSNETSPGHLCSSKSKFRASMLGSQYRGSDTDSAKCKVKLKRKRRTGKSLMREKLEKTFKEKGFLIQTQQLESAEGATYCKFRQLRKFTRYLFRSWKDYLPDHVKEISDNSRVPGAPGSQTRTLAYNPNTPSASITHSTEQKDDIEDMEDDDPELEVGENQNGYMDGGGDNDSDNENTKVLIIPESSPIIKSGVTGVQVNKSTDMDSSANKPHASLVGRGSASNSQESSGEES